MFREDHYDVYALVRSNLNALGLGARTIRHSLAYGDVLTAVDALHPDITHIDPVDGDRLDLYRAARAAIGRLPEFGIDPGAALAAIDALDTAWATEQQGVSGHDLRPAHR